MFIFEWLNAQLLKMDWLSNLVAKLVTEVFNLDLSTRLGGSLHFFIYDVIKIFILLFCTNIYNILYTKFLSTRKNETYTR